MKVRALLILSAVVLPVVASADVSKDDYRIYVETREALSDERVQKMPEDKRIPAIAKVNFKMKGEQLQAILDAVDGTGGQKGIADRASAQVREAFAASPMKDRIKEVRTDASAAHVVTYVTWTVEDPAKVEAEAVLLALKAGEAGSLASTFYLEAQDLTGASLFRAKIGADRTSNIKEDRIADWAKTRYLRLFEVETAAN